MALGDDAAGDGVQRGEFDDDVTGAFEDIGIVAEAADHAIIARAADEAVVAGAGLQDIVAAVAGEGDVRRPRVDELLDPCVGIRGRVADRGACRVGDRERAVDQECVLVSVERIRGRCLHDDVWSGDVDHVGIVAGAADEGVRTRPAIEDVVASAADEAVVPGETVDGIVAGEAVDGIIERCSKEEVITRRADARAGDINDIFDVGESQSAKTESDVGGVGAAAEIFEDHIPQVVDVVGVVAEAAGHRVGTGETVEDVVAGVAVEDVVRGVAGAADVIRAGEREVLKVCGESK